MRDVCRHHLTQFYAARYSQKKDLSVSSEQKLKKLLRLMAEHPTARCGAMLDYWRTLV